MTTISDKISQIAQDVQCTFEELMKLLLRKTIRPTLNPLSTNTRIIYNPVSNRFERGYLGASPDDNIGKYCYVMTNESIGWTGNAITNFRAFPRFTKNTNYPFRYPKGAVNTRNSLLPRNPIAYSAREKQEAILNGRIEPLSTYKNFIRYVTTRSMINNISNRKAGSVFVADVSYTDSFRQLQSIGQDIIGQTNPAIPQDTANKMSTVLLRTHLLTLEQNLSALSISDPNIYCAYIDMILLINSIQRNNLNWLITLIANLSCQTWEEIPLTLQQRFIRILGNDFISAFNSNELITILLQGENTSHLILTSSYLYSLLKMLFNVFGYSELTPNIVDSCVDGNGITPPDSSRTVNACPNDPRTPGPPPVDSCIYDFIKLFGDLYPTLTSLMGGTEVFPPEDLEIACNEIPANYDSLETLPEFFWRYNDYSYCQYLNYVGAKQLDNAINLKVNAKFRYLQSL